MQKAKKIVTIVVAALIGIGAITGGYFLYETLNYFKRTMRPSRRIR